MRIDGLDRDVLMRLLLERRETMIRSGLPADAAWQGYNGVAYTLTQIEAQLDALRRNGR